MPFPRRSQSELQPGDFPELLSLQAEAARRLRLADEPELTRLFWECNERGAEGEGRAASPGRELDGDELMGIVDVIAQDFDIRRLSVSVIGGEPLLRPDLPELVGRLRRKGVAAVDLVTGGRLLDGEAARRLAGAGLCRASVRVDAGDERDGVAAIETACAEGLLVEAVTGARPAALERLGELERTVRDAGATRWRLVSDDAVRLAPPHVRHLLDFIERRRAELASAGELFEVCLGCGGFLGVGRERAVRPEGSQCLAALGIACLLGDGQVAACPALPRALAQGSALQTRFTQIWYTGFEQLRDLARCPVACEGCDWFQLCLGGGLHERLLEPGRFCWLQRQGGG